MPLLEECIYRQTYPHALLEWVIIDDSDDVTSFFQPDQSKGLNICYQRLESKHVLGKKRNLANSFCKGDIIMYMDDDDYYPKERVAHAVEKLTGSEDILMAACSKMPILFLPERELWVSGPFGNNHGTAGTFAFKRQLLDQTSFNDLASSAEEKHFLKDYTIPMVQLEPSKTILCMAHGSNTFEKRRLKQGGSKKRFQRYSSEGLDKLEHVISAYANVAMKREQKQNRLLIEKEKTIEGKLKESI